jgi:hypothetical protein
MESLIVLPVIAAPPPTPVPPPSAFLGPYSIKVRLRSAPGGRLPEHLLSTSCMACGGQSSRGYTPWNRVVKRAVCWRLPSTSILPVSTAWSRRNRPAQFIGVCSSSTLAERLTNGFAISEPIICPKARLLDAASLPWTRTLTFYKLREIERI